MKEKKGYPTFNSKEERYGEMLVAALRGEEFLSSLSSERSKEDKEKLDALCERYGITNVAGAYKYFELSLCLARILHPSPVRRGRKRKWNKWIGGFLVVEIERLIDSSSKNVNWACQSLAKKEPWKSFLETKDSSLVVPSPAEALRKAFYEYRENDQTGRLRDAFRDFDSALAISDWDTWMRGFMKNKLAD